MNIYRDLTQEDRIQWLKQRKLTVHVNPYEVYLEVTRGCNRACGFCGVPKEEKALKEGQFKFMTSEDFEVFFNPVPSTVKKWCFAGAGEPMWNPEIADLISAVRKRVPDAQISVMTNGDPLKDQVRLRDLLLSSVNFVHWDVYDDSAYEWVMSCRGFIEAMGYEFHFNPGSEIWANKNHKAHVVVICDVRGQFSDRNNTRRFHWWAGVIPFSKGKKYNPRVDWRSMPLKKTCSYPFKHCLVTYDGEVSPCCADTLCTMSMGSLKNNSLKEVWQGERFQALRFLLKNKRRDLIDPCSMCSNHTFRDGVYPHWGRLYTYTEAQNVVSKGVRMNHTQECNLNRLKEVHSE